MIRFENGPDECLILLLKLWRNHGPVSCDQVEACGTSAYCAISKLRELVLHDLYRDARLGEKSEACLRKAVQVAPTKLGYHLHLIRWLMDQARQEEALEEAQRTRRCFPKNPEVQNLLSEILAMKAPPAVESRRSCVST